MKLTDKPYWVKAEIIQQVTGWDREGMRKARRNDYVKWKHNKGEGFWYDLNSVHPLLIKQRTLEAVS